MEATETTTAPAEVPAVETTAAPPAVDADVVHHEGHEEHEGKATEAAVDAAAEPAQPVDPLEHVRVKIREHLVGKDASTIPRYKAYVDLYPNQVTAGMFDRAWFDVMQEGHPHDSVATQSVPAAS